MIKKNIKLLLFIFIFAVIAVIYLRFGCEDSHAISVSPQVVGSAATDSVRINFGTIDTTYYPAVLDADSLIILIYPPDNAAAESLADGGTGVFNLTPGYYQYHRRGSNATPDLGVYTVCVKAWRGSAIRGIGTCSYLVTPAGTYHYGVQDSIRDLVKDSVANAIHASNKVNFYNWSDAQRDEVIDSLFAVLDSIQAGFGSRTAIGDTNTNPFDASSDEVILADDAITATKIAANAIGASEIATDAINATKIATNAIGNLHLQVSTIGASEIAANAIGASEIAPGAITSSEAPLLAAIADTANAILDTIQVHAPHGNDWGQGGGSLAAIADTVNALLDTIQAHAPHGNDWGQGGGSLAAIADTVNAVLDTLQAGYGSRTAIGDTIQRNANAGEVTADMVKISGDATAADNFETMLDGTGGQKLSLASLEIRASDNDTAIIAVGSGSGRGGYLKGGTTIATPALEIRAGAISPAVWLYSASAEGIEISAGADGIYIASGGGYHDIDISGGISGNIYGTIDSCTGVARVDSVRYVDTVGTPVSATCAGWGAYTLTLYLLDDSDSTAVPGVRINIYDSTSGVPQGGHVTTATGIRQFSLDALTATIHMQDPPNAITSPEYMTISADTTDTFWVNIFDIGTPPEATKCRIYVWESDFQDSVMGGCKLTVSIPPKYWWVKTSTGNPIFPREITVTSDSDSGLAYIDVYRSDSLTSSAGVTPVLYDISFTDSQNRLFGPKKVGYNVPASTSHKIVW